MCGSEYVSVCVSVHMYCIHVYGVCMCMGEVLEGDYELPAGKGD